MISRYSCNTKKQKIAHGGQSVLHWMMDNIYICTDSASNIKNNKVKSTGKIDDVVKENNATTYQGNTPQDDVMDRLLRSEKGMN
ncbi:terminase TerL endonuclease subunit [Ligilactobacillus agilis]|uniref:terminase TerL endonuclease subunit n=1 Tax=Ligilactobacillus agilis TaxID=1601 RepID=UPI0017854BC2|nr:terminase TerL endonuclease subunit [Ligilactobacillus agilis]